MTPADADAADPPGPADIAAAYERIRPYVRRTPVLDLGDDGPGGRPVTLKLEHMQHTGTFKARGAFNAMLAAGVPAAGVVAASGGNHGAAVAFAARALGHRAEIFVPEIADPAKLARLERYGAALNVVGMDFAEALAACEARRAETGARLLHAYDQPEIVTGQGTVARELADQAAEIDTLLVAVGGGGLIGGIAAWYRGTVKVVAVETEGTASLHTARERGAPADIAVSGIAADSLGARRVGRIAYAAASAHVADSVLVPDSEVVRARAWLWERLRQVVEPGGATALAALLAGAYVPAPGERVAVLVCGANCDPGGVLAG